MTDLNELREQLKPIFWDVFDPDSDAEGNVQAALDKAMPIIALAAVSDTAPSEGWSTEERRTAEAEAKRRWYVEFPRTRTDQEGFDNFNQGCINGFILGAEWWKAMRAEHAKGKCVCTSAIAGISDGPNVDCPTHARPTPSEEQIEAATWALIDWDTDIVDRGVRDEHYRERRAEVERIAPILVASVPSPTPSEGERGALLEMLAEQLADALPATAFARSIREQIADAILARGFHLTPPAPVDREKQIEDAALAIANVMRRKVGLVEISVMDYSYSADHECRAYAEAALAVSPSPSEVDERIIAWEAVAAHPAIKTCYEEERPLLHAVLDRLSLLAGIEMTVDKCAPAPARDEWESAQPALTAISAWLDGTMFELVASPEELTVNRVLKLSEEVGEVVSALIGAQGTNPRKGVTNTLEAVLDELLDVAVTALAAYEHIDAHQERALSELHSKILGVASRAGLAPDPWLPVTEEER